MPKDVQQIHIYVPKRRVKFLDERANNLGTSRNHIINLAISEYQEKETNRAKGVNRAETK